MSQTNLKPAGFLPEDLVAGGLKTDFNGEFTNLEWDYFTYSGKDGAPGKTAFGLHVHFTDEEGEEGVQFYSAGDAQNWQPSADKSQPIPITEGKGLNDNSNYALFIKSVIEVGVPPNKLTSVKDLIGGVFFMSRVAAPARAGLDSDDGKKRTVLVAKKLIRLPWDARKTAGGKKAAGAGSKANGAAAAAPGGDGSGVAQEIADACTDILSELLNSGDFPDGLALKAIMPRISKDKVLAKEQYASKRAEITKAILNPQVLSVLPGFSYENGIVNFG